MYVNGFCWWSSSHTFTYESQFDVNTIARIPTLCFWSRNILKRYGVRQVACFYFFSKYYYFCCCCCWWCRCYTVNVTHKCWCWSDISIIILIPILRYLLRICSNTEYTGRERENERANKQIILSLFAVYLIFVSVLSYQIHAHTE